MTYEVRIVGELVLPEGALSRFRELTLDGIPFADWPESLMPTPNSASAIEGVQVGRWIDDCENFLPAGERAFLELDVDDDKLTAVGLLADPEFEEWKRPLATLFRIGGAVGGVGELYFWRVSVGGLDFGYRIVVGGGSSQVERIDGVARLPAFPQRRERPTRKSAFEDEDPFNQAEASGVYPTAPNPNDTKGIDP